MTRLFTLLATCALLAACGDPLAKVDKLSSVDLADDAVSVGALPDPASEAAGAGLFSGLFSRRQAAAPAPVPSSTDAAITAALSEVSAEQVAAAPPAAPRRRGLLGFMRGKDAPQPALEVEQLTAAAPQGEVEQALPVEAEKTAAVIENAPAAVAKPRKGLFGLLAGARAKDKDQAADEAATVRTASLGPVAQSPERESKPALFGKNNRAHKGPDTQIVPFGTTLPAGAVARVCDLPSGRLGKEVGKYPERGRGYKIFDSNSGGSGPRPFYVTGFGDGCARTFTAALALFGSPSMHEQLRYGLPGSVQPYSTTDKAYEGIKQSICGVPRKKACGAEIGLLEKDTAFISIYDRIGSNSKWSNLLLHKGWVLAADRKG